MRPASKLLVLQFAATALVWGASFLFIKVGLRGLSPLQVAAGRLVLGAAALGVVVLLFRVRLPRNPKVWGHIAVASATLCIIPFTLYAWAEQSIASGLASIYNATTPLMTMAVTFLALRSERPGRAQLTGLLAGLAGVMVLLSPWRFVGHHDGPLAAQLACLAATLSYGVAFVYMRRFVTPLGLPAFAIAFVQVGLGAAVMAVLVPIVDHHPVVLSPEVVGCMLGLGVLGTGLAYAWNANVIAGWGAAVASSVTYLTPVIGVLLGALLLGERISWNQPLGGAVVVAGIVVSRREGRTTPRTAK